MTQPEIHSFPVEVRFSDVDSMGHVNNAVYFTYFEEGRKHLFFKTLASGEKARFDFILAKATCDYRLPIMLEDRVILEIWVGNVGGKSFTFNYKIRDAGEAARIFATGETVMVAYDYETGKSIQIPDGMRAVLSGQQR